MQYVAKESSVQEVSTKLGTNAEGKSVQSVLGEIKSDVASSGKGVPVEETIVINTNTRPCSTRGYSSALYEPRGLESSTGLRWFPAYTFAEQSYGKAYDGLHGADVTQNLLISAGVSSTTGSWGVYLPPNQWTCIPIKIPDYFDAVRAPIKLNGVNFYSFATVSCTLGMKVMRSNAQGKPDRSKILNSTSTSVQGNTQFNAGVNFTAQDFTPGEIIWYEFYPGGATGVYLYVLGDCSLATNNEPNVSDYVNNAISASLLQIVHRAAPGVPVLYCSSATDPTTWVVHQNAQYAMFYLNTTQLQVAQQSLYYNLAMDNITLLERINFTKRVQANGGDIKIDVVDTHTGATYATDVQSGEDISSLNIKGDIMLRVRFIKTQTSSTCGLETLSFTAYKYPSDKQQIATSNPMIPQQTIAYNPTNRVWYGRGTVEYFVQTGTTTNALLICDGKRVSGGDPVNGIKFYRSCFVQGGSLHCAVTLDKEGVAW